MIDARLDARLRGLPGVLDCSVIDGGVALLVHPEVDGRVLRARAQAVMAQMGDDRPLVVLGGMAPPAPQPASPFSLGLFVVAVLCLLAALPNVSAGRVRPAFNGPLAAAAQDGGLTPELTRPRLSYALAAAGPRATRHLAELAVAPVVPPPGSVAAEDASDPAARARHPRRATQAHAAAPAQRPVPAAGPAVSTLTIVRASDAQPGRSGAHRRFPKDSAD